MQLTSAAPSAASPGVPIGTMASAEAGLPVGTGADPRFAQYKVIRRNGSVVGFEPAKITIAMTKAFLAVHGGQSAASASVRDEVTRLTDVVVGSLMKRKPEGGAIHIEEIQDQVELSLMRSGAHEVARAYVLYRERRSQERAQQKPAARQEAVQAIEVIENGVRKPLDIARLTALVRESCEGLADVDAERILRATLKDLYDGVPMDEVRKGVVLAARTLIEKDPQYSYVTARLLLDALRFEALGEPATQADMASKYAEYFPQFVKHGVKIGLLNEALLQFDMGKLGAALKPERDLQFGYLGLQTLYDRYFLVDQYAVHANAGRRFELPQCFFMRVAMGLALNEVEREARAIEFYDVLSTFDFMSSTPTLFNSGTHRSQLSSCYLTTVADDLDGIYEAIKENALLSKFAGGLGNDWTNVRAMGSHIKGTNGKSQGVVPFLKVVNDTAVAVNQGGKRKGAVCTYLESWHLDIEEFLELRKNTGDDRRRTHDMNTANWIPDLFMKRVVEGGDWTLFSPSDVPDLHDKWGRAFEEAYTRYEDKVARGELKLYKRIPAVQLWRKMLSMLFETGHPWITFKDACNVRSPQQHVGTVHSSNLCTEITLNTSDTEIAVCNLGSVNLLGAHGEDGRRLAARPGEAEAHDHDGDAHARQRDRHQLLRGGEGAQQQPEAPSGGARHHGLPGLPAPAAGPVRVGRRDALRRRVDGSPSATTPTGRRPSWPRSAAATARSAAASGTAASCRRTRSSCCATSAAATSRPTSRRRWTGTRCARASANTACATRTAWRSRRRRRSPTSSACPRRSSPTTRTSTSSRTSPASSRS